MTLPRNRSSSTHAALLAVLRALPELADLEEGSIEPAGFTGMAHEHLRLKGRGLILRIPRVSQWGLPAEVNLAYQASAFRRAAASGHSPLLSALLPPSPALPMGALLVEEIRGRKVRLPGDLPAIALCLSRIHRLPLPAPAARRPLLSPEPALAQMLATIELQSGFIAAAKLAPDAAALIADERAWAGTFVAARARAAAPTALIVTDSHPGNFVVDDAGKAWFVDLEKAMYALPAIDLAHATLYTSTRFDPDVDAVLTRTQTRAFYRSYLATLDGTTAAALVPWLAPLRRLVWLRTLTWCVKWTVESREPGGWSRQWLAPRALAHMEDCLADFLSPACIARLSDELRRDEDEGLAP
ncbi:MAG: phosphotransferase [Alphaproteobacteria bacterium]